MARCLPLWLAFCLLLTAVGGAIWWYDNEAASYLVIVALVMGAIPCFIYLWDGAL